MDLQSAGTPRSSRSTSRELLPLRHDRVLLRWAVGFPLGHLGVPTPNSDPHASALPGAWRGGSARTSRPSRRPGHMEVLDDLSAIIANGGPGRLHIHCHGAPLSGDGRPSQGRAQRAKCAAGLDEQPGPAARGTGTSSCSCGCRFSPCRPPGQPRSNFPVAASTKPVPWVCRWMGCASQSTTAPHRVGSRTAAASPRSACCAGGRFASSSGRQQRPVRRR